MRKSSSGWIVRELNVPKHSSILVPSPLCGDVALPQPFRRCRRVKADHATDPEVWHSPALCHRVDVFARAPDQFGQFAGGPCLFPALDQSDDVRRNGKTINRCRRRSGIRSCDVFMHRPAWSRSRCDAIRLASLCWPERLLGCLLRCGTTRHGDLSGMWLWKMGL